MWQNVITALIILGAFAYVMVQMRARRRRSEAAACGDGCYGCPHAHTEEEHGEGCRGPARANSRDAPR